MIPLRFLPLLGLTVLLIACPSDPSVSAERTGPGTLTLRWNSVELPLLIVRNPATDRILAIARSGSIPVWTPGTELEAVLSNGTRTAALRLRP